MYVCHCAMQTDMYSESIWISFDARWKAQFTADAAEEVWRGLQACRDRSRHPPREGISDWLYQIPPLVFLLLARRGPRLSARLPLLQPPHGRSEPPGAPRPWPGLHEGDRAELRVAVLTTLLLFHKNQFVIEFQFEITPQTSLLHSGILQNHITSAGTYAAIPEADGVAAVRINYCANTRESDTMRDCEI